MKKTITIDTNHVVGTPNPKMWGIFYEDINHSGDGGLYGELIRNRSFADANIPENTTYSNGKISTLNGFTHEFDISDLLPGWHLHKELDAVAVMDRYINNPRNPECREQLRLTVADAGCGVMITNDGFWGIAAKKGGYHGYIIMRSEGISNITLGLSHKNGIVSCEQEISIKKDTFEKYEFSLECQKDDMDSRFFIKVKQKGKLYIDFVTLFPNDTYKEQKFGLRRDIMQKLLELKPGFVRFPGGCVVEGINLENATHWKNTRGPMEDRPGHWLLWGYRCTDGIGILELCQLAEEFNSDIMYVINCGISCQGRKPEIGDDEKVDYWIREALDAIEYICGGKDTKWGAVRAKDGHPEPFSLKYVEIGNENRNEEYYVRYRKVYKAIKDIYPDLTLIANQMVPDASIDMIDDHYYGPPPVFVNRYDRYDGEGDIDVYVGEYGCNKEVGYGNLMGAVAESVFMINMENCCDRVKIASYAPLLCNNNNRRWSANLINFDNHRIFGIPSYYIQRLFVDNKVEKVVANDNTIDRRDITTCHFTCGVIGNELVIKAANFGKEHSAITFKLKDGVVTDGNAFIIAGEKKDDTNTLDNPEAISDAKVPLIVNGNIFDFMLEPYSFAVLRLKFTDDQES